MSTLDIQDLQVSVAGVAELGPVHEAAIAATAERAPGLAGRQP